MMPVGWRWSVSTPAFPIERLGQQVVPMHEIVDRIQGPCVPIMPAFDEQGGLDLDSTCRWVDWMAGQGMRLFWTTQGTSHYMCLTDEEVVELNRAVARTLGGRGTFIASTAMHWPVERVRRFIADAAGWGVSAVKLQINWLFTPSDQAVLEFYKAIAQDSPLPLFAYSLALPGFTGGLSNKVLEQVLEIPQFVGMKNDAGDFYEHAAYLRTARTAGHEEFRAMTGGSLSSFLFGYDFGARAYADVTGWYRPKLALEFHQAMQAGRRERAIEIVKTWEEPMMAEYRKLRGGEHWAWGHAALKFTGAFRSHQMRFPLRALEPAQIEQVRQFMIGYGMLEGEK